MAEPGRRRRAGARAAGGPATSEPGAVPSAPADDAVPSGVLPTAGVEPELPPEPELPAELRETPRSRRELRAERAAAKNDRPLGQSSPWVPALMVTFFLLGLLWLVVYYLAGDQVPVMSDLGNWNLLVGIGAIAVGFVVSTQWR